MTGTKKISNWMFVHDVKFKIYVVFWCLCCLTGIASIILNLIGLGFLCFGDSGTFTMLYQYGLGCLAIALISWLIQAVTEG